MFQVTCLGLAEYRSPTPMITAAFVVDDAIMVNVPTFPSDSTEGVRREIVPKRGAMKHIVPHKKGCL